MLAEITQGLFNIVKAILWLIGSVFLRIFSLSAGIVTGAAFSDVVPKESTGPQAEELTVKRMSAGSRGYIYYHFVAAVKVGNRLQYYIDPRCPVEKSTWAFFGEGDDMAVVERSESGEYIVELQNYQHRQILRRQRSHAGFLPLARVKKANIYLGRMAS